MRDLHAHLKQLIYEGADLLSEGGHLVHENILGHILEEGLLYFHVVELWWGEGTMKVEIFVVQSA